MFVGRAAEILDFRENLLLPPSDPGRRFVFNICGQGGMGKTTLLRRLTDIAAAQGLRTARIDEGQPDPLTAMEAIAHVLQQKKEYQGFLDRLEIYRDYRHKLETDADAPANLGTVVGAAIGRGGLALGRRIPGAGIAFDFVDEDAAAAQMSEIGAFITRKLTDHRDAALVRDPLSELVPLFLSGLRNTCSSTDVGLFIDTFEAISALIEPWLLDIFAGQYGAVPSNLLIVVAGRHSLDPDSWSPYQDLITRLDLEPFTAPEATEFLHRRGMTDPHSINEFIRLSDRVPILLATLASQPGSTSMDPSQSTDTAVDRFLKGVTSPKQRQCILRSSLPRCLDSDTFNIVATGTDVTDFSWLRGQPFVSESSVGWAYHAVVRSQLLRHQTKESPTESRSIHLALRDHYATLNSDVASEDLSRVYNASWTRRDIERSYHSLMANYEQELPNAIHDLLDIWGIDPDLTRPWAAALAQCEVETDVQPDTTRIGHTLLKAIDAYKVGRFIEVTAAFDLIVRQVSMPDATKALVLRSRSQSYRRRNDVESAIGDIDEALDLLPDNPVLLRDRAYLMQNLRRFDEALADLDAASKQMPDDLTLQGAVATHRARLIWIADGPKAALPVLDELLAQRSLPWAHLTRGQIHSALGNTDAAVDDFKQAISESDQFAHEAYKEMGVVLLDAKRFGESQDALRCSLDAEPSCSHCWRVLGHALRSEYETDTAAAHLLETFPDTTDASVIACRAAALHSIGASSIALDEFGRALELEPHAAWIWQARGTFNLIHGDAPAALADAERALSLDHRHWSALILRARSEQALGALEASASDYEHAAEINPGASLRIINEHTAALNAVGRFTGAVDRLRSAIAQDNDDAAIRYNLAIAVICAEGVAQAADEIDNAKTDLEAVEDDHIREYGLAGILAITGADDAAALDGLERAITLDRVCEEWARTDPAWERLRTDTKFRNLVSETPDQSPTSDGTDG